MPQYRSSKLRSIGVCAAIAVGTSLGVLAPPAMAAPPNDEFANRASLGDQLPLHLTESNAEATRDGFLEINSFAKGHSIWWEWESPGSRWTTVSTCDSEFRTSLGIFEGDELTRLTRLSNGSADEGPGCYESQTRYTFWAQAGHRYDIGADGNGFYLPPQEPPSGEGTISLSIEATPPPPNDDFADATAIEGPYDETNANPITEPGGPKRLTRQIFGYTWNATAEAGEPTHAGVPGRASVWYRWIPPTSGEARLDLQYPQGPDLLSLYAGTSLNALTPLGSVTEPFESLRAHVDAGTEYRVAVDGASAGGKPTMGALKLDLAVIPDQPTSTPLVTGADSPAGHAAGADPAAAGKGGSPRSAVPAPPVLERPSIDPAGHAAIFRFHGSGRGLSYRCKVDAKRFRGCSSPYRVDGLVPGMHRIEVQAHAPGGAFSRAAVVHFRVPAAHRHRHQAG
jgi:hypothetical protein